jgi:hypothetical protein
MLISIVIIVDEEQWDADTGKCEKHRGAGAVSDWAMVQPRGRQDKAEVEIVHRGAMSDCRSRYLISHYELFPLVLIVPRFIPDVDSPVS